MVLPNKDVAALELYAIHRGATGWNRVVVRLVLLEPPGSVAEPDVAALELGNSKWCHWNRVVVSLVLQKPGGGVTGVAEIGLVSQKPDGGVIGVAEIVLMLRKPDDGVTGVAEIVLI